MKDNAENELPAMMEELQVTSPCSTGDITQEADVSLQTNSEVSRGKIFHPFPRLPAEIRIRSWTLVIEARPGRRVPIRMMPDAKEYDHHGFKIEKLHQYWSPKPYPDLAHVSFEVRKILLDTAPAKLVPDTSNLSKLEELGNCVRNVSPIIVDPSKDVLCFDSSATSQGYLYGGLTKALEEVWPNVRYILVEHMNVSTWDPPDPIFAKMLRLDLAWKRENRSITTHHHRTSRWPADRYLRAIKPGTYDIVENGKEIWGKPDYFMSSWRIREKCFPGEYNSDYTPFPEDPWYWLRD